MRKSRTDGQILDWRSTGRRRARSALFESRIDYSCVGYTDTIRGKVSCGKTTIAAPKDAPKFFAEIWPSENRVLGSPLQADHESKDVTNNDVSELAWRCPSCHKLQDKQTEKGVSQQVNPHGYDIPPGLS